MKEEERKELTEIMYSTDSDIVMLMTILRITIGSNNLNKDRYKSLISDLKAVKDDIGEIENKLKDISKNEEIK